MAIFWCFALMLVCVNSIEILPSFFADNNIQDMQLMNILPQESLISLLTQHYHAVSNNWSKYSKTCVKQPLSKRPKIGF